MVSAFAASQIWLPFPAVLEAQVGISFAVKPGHSEAFKNRNLLGFMFSEWHSKTGGAGCSHIVSASVMVSRHLIKSVTLLWMCFTQWSGGPNPVFL